MSYQPQGATQGAGVQTDVTQGQQRRTDGLGGFPDYDPTTGLAIDPNNQSTGPQAYSANATASELLDQYNSDGRRQKK
jgi:hypothetical protein